MDEIGKITGGKDGAELLTLGITTKGEMYTIGTDGALYSLRLNDDARGATATYIGETDFVNVENYSGTNVIQSMGYDHNTGTMYWFALSQGDKVQLVGFGGFETKKREARMGRNPKTKEAIEIPATTIPVFKAGKALKEKTAK